MNQSSWINTQAINTQAKKAALTMATLAAGALAVLSLSSPANAYPGAPLPFDEILSLKGSCRLANPEKPNQVRIGLVENVGITPDPTCANQKPRLVLVSEWVKAKRGQTPETIEQKTHARYAYTSYYGEYLWYLTYRVEILNPDGSKINLPMTEIEYDRSLRLLPLMSQHSPMQATLTYVSNKLSGLSITPDTERHKTLPIVATCTTKKNVIHTYTSRISETAEHLTAQENCPDGSQMTLEQSLVKGSEKDWETVWQNNDYNQTRGFYKTNYAISVKSKFGVELASFSVNGTTWNAYVLDLKTASEKHPVLLTYDVEKNVIIDLKAQVNPRQF